MRINKLCSIVALSIFTLVACKKSKVTPTPTPPVVVPPTTNSTATRAELSKDSIFLYAKEIYLWSNKLPTYEVFNPRKYTSSTTELDNYKQELFEIAQYSNPYEYKTGSIATSPKYSYIFDKANQNPTAALNDSKANVDLEGNGNDIGLRLVPYLTNDVSRTYLLFVTAVYQNSPGEKAGLKRGMVITKINGQTYGAHYENERTALNNALNSSSVNVEGRTYLTSVPFTAALTKTVYKSSPLYATKVFTTGTKKIGYFAFARFSKLTVPSSTNPSDINLDTLFTTFANKGVTDLIIDLRYNGGGYVSTAEYMLNLITPSGNNGKVMYTEYFNSLMQSNQAKILKNQPLLNELDRVQYTNGRIVNYYDDVDYSVAANTYKFNKKGSLNGVQNVVFLVTGSTASASELVINSLKPYLNVKVIGLTTYGKPVGFFPVTIENKYDVYFSLFETKNSLGAGGYYDGIVPEAGYNEDLDKTGKFWDDVRYDFGDSKEGYLAGALNILAPGVTVFSYRASSTMSINGQTVNVTSISPMQTVNGNGFVGMVEDRVRRK